MKEKILGRDVRDRISGFTGIAETRVDYITGCAQYCVTPRAKDNKCQMPGYFDEGRLEVIGKGIVDEISSFPEVLPKGPPFGYKARDVVTGYEGVVVAALVEITNVWQLGLAPTIDKDGKLGDTVYFNHQRIETLEEIVVSKEDLKPENKDTEQEPGGDYRRDQPPT